MTKYLLLLILLTSGYISSAQTWSDDVAQIVYDKCATCHRAGGIAPFSLVTYAEASPMAQAMSDAINGVNGNVMPPWPPNNDYQNYCNDKSLSAAQITTLTDWNTNGAQEGTPGNTPPPPVFQSGSILGPGDLEIQIPTYMSKATAGVDDYVCFAMPSNLPIDRVIKSVEIIPGNIGIVHHALIFIDPTGNCFTDTVGSDCGGPSSPAAALVMGYTPGSSPLTLPAVNPLKLGIPFPANSQVYFAMHYPDGSYGQYDSTRVIFHFYPPGETGIRPVITSRILENWSFSLPPNQVTAVTDQYPAVGTLTVDYSLLSVFPHMHLLGQSMKIYGIKPNLDTLKLIDVPDWDFHWQDFYFYKYIQKAEIGTLLKAEAMFDNTAGNLENPNSPPITVGAGLNTSDEMMLAYMHYMSYLPGDELYNMDSLMNISASATLEENFGKEVFSVYPNPFSEGLKIYSSEFSSGDVVSVHIYDSKGTLMTRLASNVKLENNELHLNWDGNNENGSSASPGLYFISFSINGTMSHQRVIKR